MTAPVPTQSPPPAPADREGGPDRPPAAPPRVRLLRGAGKRIRWEIAVPLALYLAFTLVPFYWLLLYSVRPAGTTGIAPWPLTLEHYDTVWNGIGFGTYFANSVQVGIAALVCTCVVALAGGYALARYDFRGKAAFLVALLGTQFIPGAMMLIPLFELFTALNLTNSLWALVIANTVFGLPLSLILLSGFVRNIPVSLEEAAWVDGCSRLRGFFTVVLPLLRPGLIAVGSFAFIDCWNNFLFALMFVSEQDKYTIPVGLSYTIGEFSVDFGALAAGGVVAAVPVVLVFAVIQRFLVQGLSAGAVKG